MTSWRSENLRVLGERAPDLAAAVAAAPAGGVTLVAATDGTAGLCVDGIPLHNMHTPAAEAERWARAELAAAGEGADCCLFVLGFGSGAHVRAIAGRWAGRIVVIEPNLAVLAAAFGLGDLRELLGRIDVRCDAPGPEELDRSLGDGAGLVATFVPALASDRVAFGAIRRTLQGRLGSRQVRLKVLVVSPIHGGTLPMTAYCARALQRLGHRVSCLDLSPFADGYRHLGAFAAQGPERRELEGRLVDLLADGVLRRIEYDEPDLVLALAQAPLTPRVLDRLAEDEVKTALWFVEDYRRFPAWRELGPHYRYVFCIQRDECMEAMAAAGIPNVHYLPCAADPAVHAPLALSAEELAAYGSAVSFVGAGYRNRRVAYRRLVGWDFKIWGSEWEGADGLWGTVVQRGGARLSTEDSVRVFNASAINVNLHSSTYVDGVDPIGDFVNPRTFELAACGAFQLVDERRYLPELLVPGREVTTFASVAELSEQIDYFLARPEERRVVAEAGRRRVLAEHTYEARMAQLLEYVLGVDYAQFQMPRARTHGGAALVEAAGPTTALGRYLQEACGTLADVSLTDLADGIRQRRGALSEEEEMIVFLKQYEDMFLGEYRR